jgi:release factor glutamine methyltransferase
MIPPTRNLKHYLKVAEDKLTTGGITSARLDAELLLGYVLDHDRSWIHAHLDNYLDLREETEFEQLIARRAAREPLVHLTSEREFYGLSFKITPDVLTPRVETEQMVEWAIKYAPDRGRLIDVGTGSGAIAVAVAKHRPDLNIYATDISNEAVAIARQNFARHGVTPELLAGGIDLFPEPGRRATNTYDVIATNLPYLRDDAELMPEVTREPAVALFGGRDGLDVYRRFLAAVPRHLAPGGYLFAECDPWQHADLIAEAAKVGLRPVEQGYFILGFQRA